MKYKVHFDYEPDDSVEVEADHERDARWLVVDQLREETCDYDDWSDIDLFHALNAIEVKDEPHQS